MNNNNNIYIYLDLPNMQNVLPLGRFFWCKGANVPHLEDPGMIKYVIYIYMSNAISITLNYIHFSKLETQTFLL